MNNIILISLIVASIAILWRVTLNKQEKLGPSLRKFFPVFLGTALTCGSCFSYWLSLFFVIIFEPIPVDYFKFNFGDNFFVHLFLSWMLVGFISVSFRFLFALVLESVDYLHAKNNGGKHRH